MKLLSSGRIAPLALTVGLLAAAPASASTLYVSPSGSDSGGCSQAAPCKSLSGAYGKSASGDTVVMAGGSYGSQSLGSGSKAVTYKTADGQTAAFGGLSIGASNLTFSGPFTASSLSTSGKAGNYVTNTVVQDGVIDGHGTTNDVGYVAAVSGVTWRRIDMGNNHEANATLFVDGGAASGSSGGVTGGVTNFTIEDSAFHDNYLAPTSSVHPQCIYLGGTQGTTIRRTRFWGCTFADVFVTTANQERDQPKNITMENNVFGRTILNGDPNVGQKPTCCHARDVVFRDGSKLDGVTFRYNTVRGPVTWPVEGVGAGGAHVYGNIFGESTGTRSGMDWHNNINGVSNAGAMWMDPNTAQTVTAGHMVAPGDFRLKAGASAIDAGDPANMPTLDLMGDARLGTPDLGAYEYGASTPAPGGGDPGTDPPADPPSDPPVSNPPASDPPASNPPASDPAPPSIPTLPEPTPPAPPPTGTQPSPNKAPSVDLSKPTAKSTFTKSLTMAASAGDDRGVARVEFRVDGKVVCRDTKSPYRCDYSVPSSTSYGSHTVSAKAYDTQGMTATDSASVTRVRNRSSSAHARSHR